MPLPFAKLDFLSPIREGAPRPDVADREWFLEVPAADLVSDEPLKAAFIVSYGEPFTDTDEVRIELIEASRPGRLIKKRRSIAFPAALLKQLAERRAATPEEAVR